MSNIIALAARVAEKLDGTTDSVEHVLESMGEDIGLELDREFCKHLDTMVFECTQCNWWYRQNQNATPDAAEWVCQECK